MTAPVAGRTSPCGAGRRLAAPSLRKGVGAWLVAVVGVLATGFTAAASDAPPPVEDRGDADRGDPIAGTIRLDGPVYLEPVPTADPADAAIPVSHDAPSRALAPPTASAYDLRVAGCLALLGAAALAARWRSRRSSQPLPAEVFAVLGEASLGGPHSARVVRFGPKTVLVSVTGATCTPLAEIDDAALTDRLADLCRAHPSAALPSLSALVPRSARRGVKSPLRGEGVA